jgi:Rhodopirellula transposase DDE domain
VADELTITARFERARSLGPLDERGRRLWAAAEARALGRGGIAAVARATGISESTVRRGLRELGRGDELSVGRVRRPGAGRIPIGQRQPGLRDDLDRLIEPSGDPAHGSPLRWTSKSGAQLGAALRARGHRVVDRTVLRMLKADGYSLQANRLTRDGARHPDRDAQFQYISRTVSAAIAASEPVISLEVCRRERGWIQVGVTGETGLLTAGAILAWWAQAGGHRYPDARTLTVTGNCGGLSSERSRGWRAGLQRVADRSALELVVCHFPAGTTKWQGTAHRWVCRERPRPRGFTRHQVVISLIARRAPTAPPTQHLWLDLEGPTGSAGAVRTSAFQGDWNYRVKPLSN